MLFGFLLETSLLFFEFIIGIIRKLMSRMNEDLSRMTAAAARFGSIDALVNVAGGTNYLQMPRLPFVEMKPENWGA